MIGSNFDVYTALQTGELIVSNIQKAFNGYKFSCVSQNTLNNATITSSPGVLYVNGMTLVLVIRGFSAMAIFLLII